MANVLRKPAIGIFIILALLIALPMVSAEIGTIKKIDSDLKDKLSISPSADIYPAIKIKDWWGISDLADLVLIDHTSSCGNDCYSLMDINTYKDIALIDSIKFYTIAFDNEGKEVSRIEQPIRGYQFYIQENDKLIPYKIGEVVPSGEYTLRLEGQKKADRTVDWVIYSQGLEIKEWGTWQNYTLMTNLAYYYNLNDAGGTTVDDIVNVKDLTATAYSGNFTGIAGTSWNISSNFLAADSSWMNNLASGSINIWVYPTSVTGKYHGILTRQHDMTGTYMTLCVDNSSTVCLGTGTAIEGAVRFQTTNGYLVNNSYSLPLNAWTMITATWNSSTQYLYLNGTLVSSNASAGGIGNDGSLTYAGIGRFNPSTYNYWAGKLDEAGFWNKTLTSTEVGLLYQNGAGLAYPFLLSNVTLNSPANNSVFTSLNTAVSFSCTGNVIGGANLVNISFWDNSTGTWKLNQTKTVTGTSATSVFNNSYSSVGKYNWTCTACDSDGDCGFGDTRILIVNTTLPIFKACNKTITMPVINFTYKEESTLTNINATIDLSSWIYWYSNPLINTTYSYTNSSASVSNHTFCISPNWSEINASFTYQYSSAQGGTYPQRTYSVAAESLSNTTTQTTLYLLSSTAGISSTYQVLTTGGAIISGALIQVERDFTGLGVWTLIDQGYTDSAGTKTFFLNPYYQHRITVTKTGYASAQVTITPSNSIYTIYLGGGTTTNVSYTSSTDGISWFKTPASGIMPPGKYNFTFWLNASLSNLENCSLELMLKNMTVMNQTSGCTAAGGTLIIQHNFTQSMMGRYSIKVNGTWIVLEADANWKNISFPATDYGIKNALKNISNLPDFGTDPQKADFSRIVFFFLLMALVISALNFYTNYDTAYPGAMLYFVTAIVIMLTLVNTGGHGYFYLDGATRIGCSDVITNITDGTTETGYAPGCSPINTFVNNWILAFNFILIALSLAFQSARRNG